MTTTYKVNTLNQFERRPHGIVYASEFRVNEGRSMHLRSQGWATSMTGLMNGCAGVSRGSTNGFITIERDEETKEIVELEIWYQVGPYNDESYHIRRDGVLVAERTNKGWNGGHISTQIFEGRVDPRNLFARVEEAVSELRKGNDVEVNDLGLYYL